MKYCPSCKTVKPIEEFHVAPSRNDGLGSHCITCKQELNANRMYVNGKYIPKTHPLHKPGRFKTLDDAWSHVDIDTRSNQGDVYVIENPAWTSWYKVGKAVLSQDRLNGYQTSSPFRDYVLVYYRSFTNRHQAEVAAHRQLKKILSEDKYSGEWFNTSLDVIIDVIEGVENEDVGVRHRDEPSPQQNLAFGDEGH